MNVTHDITTVIRDHQPLVRRSLRRFGVRERDLPDATQDVFIVVHRRLSTFEGRSKLSTWIYRIAFHVASQHRRRACNRRELLEEVEATTTCEQERRDRIEQVTHALEQLDPERRNVLVDFELDEQPMAVIAARLGIPLKTAFSRLYAARRDLGRRLRECGLAIMVPSWWPRRSHPSLTLITTLAAVVLLVPELHPDVGRNLVVAQPIPMHTTAQPRPALVTERFDVPTTSVPLRIARKARRTIVSHTAARAPEPTPPETSRTEDLIVFHDSDVALTPRVPPPMLAELPPAPAREPRIQLRGARDAGWSLRR